jgi:hypothetical protein
MPTPIPAPVAPTSYPVSGGTYAAGSAFTQTSGPPIEYAEYRQTLTIDYTRNPGWTLSAPRNPYWDLTQLSSNEVKNVTSTSLHANIHTVNTCTKITSNYALSATLQMQKFQLNSSKFDKIGLTYGEVDGSSNSYVFGPQGSIVTTQPYVRRKLWDAATDVEYNFATIGTSHGMVVSGEGNYQGTGNSLWGVGNDLATPYADYVGIGQDLPGEPATPHISKKMGGDDYAMYGGGYNTSAEAGFGDNVAGLLRLVNYIETACNHLKDPFAGHWFERWIVRQPASSNGYVYPQENDRCPVNPYYSTSFHDYT